MFQIESDDIKFASDISGKNHGLSDVTSGINIEQPSEGLQEDAQMDEASEEIQQFTQD